MREFSIVVGLVAAISLAWWKLTPLLRPVTPPVRRPSRPDSGRPHESASQPDPVQEAEYPTWLVIVLSFIFGAVVAGASIGPSEYQRGHASGYVAGRDDATEIGNKTLQKMMSIMERQNLAESR